MKTLHLTTKLIAASSALLFALTLTPLCFAQAKTADKPAAQAPAQRQLISLQFLRIKPGMGAEWREFRKNETLPMLQKAGTKQQTLWSTAVFGEGGYLVVTGIESLAQYDSPSPVVRTLGQEGAAAYQTKAARFVESAHSVAIESRPDLSLVPPTGDQAKLILITTTTIEQGHATEYENFIKTQVLPAVKKAAPKGYLVAQVVYGGNLNQYIAATLLDSFADLQKYREAINKEIAAAKITGKGVGIVRRENAIYRLVPELSILPAPQKAENK
jgi:hypothetical protein